jgi:hypothetical protein
LRHTCVAAAQSSGSAAVDAALSFGSNNFGYALRKISGAAEIVVMWAVGYPMHSERIRDIFV